MFINMQRLDQHGTQHQKHQIQVNFNSLVFIPFHGAKIQRGILKFIQKKTLLALSNKVLVK